MAVLSHSPDGGTWITPAFSAGNFTANGTMTWTVEAGDITTYQYNIRGKVMILCVSLITTTVVAPVNSELRVAIPGGFLAAARVMANAGLVNNNGVRVTGYVDTAAAGNGYMAFVRTDGASWSASTNATAVFGSLTFPIQ